MDFSDDDELLCYSKIIEVNCKIVIKVTVNYMWTFCQVPLVNNESWLSFCRAHWQHLDPSYHYLRHFWHWVSFSWNSVAQTLKSLENLVNLSKLYAVQPSKAPTLLTISFFSPFTQNQIIRAASTPANNATANDDENGEVVIRKKETDEVLKRDGALNQFISELSSNIHGRRYSEAPSPSTRTVTVNDEERKSVSAVSENGPKPESSTIETNDKVSDNSTAVELEHKNSQSEVLAKPSHFVTVIEVKESEAPTTTSSSKITTTATSSFKSVRSGYENVIIENNKRNSNLINDMDRSSNTTSSFTSSFNNVRPSAQPIGLLQDSKKKIPPRWVDQSFSLRDDKKTTSSEGIK